MSRHVEYVCVFTHVCARVERQRVVAQLSKLASGVLSQAICTDMGTELSLANIPGAQAADFLPYWMQGQGGCLEEDVADVANMAHG